MPHEHYSETRLASGLVLAGGTSRRMGRDKAWIELGGRALIERVLERLREVCQEVIVVANNRQAYEGIAPIVVGDAFPGKGSLGGIYSGLKVARFDRAVVVACDMPFLKPNLLRFMVTLSDGYDVVIPRGPGLRMPDRSVRNQPARSKANHQTAKDSDLHPLHAVYSKECLGPIEARLRADDLRMISFFPDVRVRVVGEEELKRLDPEHLSLFNVNTPEELTFAESLLAQQQASI